MNSAWSRISSVYGLTSSSALAFPPWPNAGIRSGGLSKSAAQVPNVATVAKKETCTPTCRTDFATRPRPRNPHPPSRAAALGCAEVLPLFRWVEPAPAQAFTPDIAIEIGADLRYQAFDVHRVVPTHYPPEQYLGERLVDRVPKDLVFQFVTAAERSICLSAPVDIRYPMIIAGRLVMSQTRVTSDDKRKVFLVDILRVTASLVLAAAV
jgi:hypothetical protein